MCRSAEPSALGGAEYFRAFNARKPMSARKGLVQKIAKYVPDRCR